MTIDIETTKPPFIVSLMPIGTKPGEKPAAPKEISIKRISVESIGYKALGDARKFASNAPDDASAQKLFFRERIKRQCKMFDGAEKPVQVTDEIISKMPVAYAFRVRDALHDVLTVVGATPELISKDADGITRAIHVRLGTPIKTGTGEIAELEFIADNLSDIEDVLISDTETDQVLALLAMAKPVGDGVNLVALPSWAVDQITIIDGVFLQQKVLKRFLESGASS